MAFTIPTLDETHAFLIALHKRHFPTIDVSEMSDEWLWLRTIAGAVTDNHAHIVAAKNDLLPDTATGETQVRWGAIRGVTKKAATPARKSSALRIVGTPATSVPDAITMTHTSGLRFRTSGASVTGAGGYVDVDVVAIDTGSATRLNAGEVLTFDAPVAGLEEAAELQLDMDEDGEDAESEGAYSARILSRFRSPPLGGAAEDYVQWALEETGIAAAYCYPLRRGAGSVDLVALHAGSGTSRILSAPEVSELQALNDAKRPVGVKSFRVLQVEAEPEDVEVTVTTTGEPAVAFDWDDTVPPVVLTWDVGTRVLTFTSTRPATMAAGHRIIVGNGATGAERVIEALSGGSAVILEADATADVPLVSSTIYAGGPLVAPARAAILALIDGLATSNPDATRFGSFEGNLRPGAIYRAATSVDGVLDGTVVAPAAVVTPSNPAYPDDATIGLVTPGRILVRRGA